MCNLTDSQRVYYCSHMATLESYTALLKSVEVAIALSGKTKKDIAIEAGIHPTTLHRILAGKRDMSVKTLFAIADATNTNPTRLIDRTLCKECLTK